MLLSQFFLYLKVQQYYKAYLNEKLKYIPFLNSLIATESSAQDVDQQKHVSSLRSVLESISSTDDQMRGKIPVWEFGGQQFANFLTKKLSNHYTTSTEAVIDSIKKISSESEKYHCCIYPTAILTQKKDLVNGYKKIKITKADYLIPVTSYDYSPLRPLEKFGSNWIKFKYNKYKKTRSQDLPELFHDTGTFYFYKTSVLLKNKGNLPLKTTYLMIDRIRTIDINEPQDLKIAKLQYNLLKSIKKNGR